jgi:hypothetical protein
MSEVSFTFSCDEKEIRFSCNYKLLALDSLFSEKQRIIKIYTQNMRVSYENGRFFDSHNLIVKKGVEAEESIKDGLNNIRGILEEGLQQASIIYSMPVSLVRKYINDLVNLSVNPKKYLDFEINSITIDLNRVIYTNKPDFLSEKTITIVLGTNKGCVKVVLRETRGNTISYSEDCRDWTEDSLKTLSILNSLHTTILEDKEIVDYLKRIIIS